MGSDFMFSTSYYGHISSDVSLKWHINFLINSVIYFWVWDHTQWCTGATLYFVPKSGFQWCLGKSVVLGTNHGSPACEACAETIKLSLQSCIYFTMYNLDDVPGSIVFVPKMILENKGPKFSILSDIT